MQKLLTIMIVAGLLWFAYGKYQQSLHTAEEEEETPTMVSRESESIALPPRDNYRCDGRTYCSQMTSCAEATFFLKNCPGTKMDGNNDGVPCEKQWCK